MLILHFFSIYCFYVTKFDATLKDGQADKLFGFLEDHKKAVDYKSIGEMSLITFNMEKLNEIQSNSQTDAVKSLLDTSHASVLALQEVSASQIRSLKDTILPHYNMVEDTTSEVLDPTTGGKTYLPIIYDSNDFTFIKSGAFKTSDKNIKNCYASWAKLKSKPLNKTFTFVNLNLYSTRSSVDDLEFANILNDVKTAGEDKNNLVILMGTINATSELSSLVIKKGLEVLSDPKDTNAHKNTLNSYLDVISNTQRDYLISIPSNQHKVQVVYSSILSKFKNGIRFPVHAIVNIVPNPESSA
ncbi:hypothetical protein NGRA_1680 [Nosema granulosis]|uniref:Uncharacterized protein n=1 Tax=Nosema granulosis TaxID=83296 RepID=A0A9P6GYF7_9MICR|nr:hypothetical protein NGRA_1680 [Nosema granulosis]